MKFTSIFLLVMLIFGVSTIGYAQKEQWGGNGSGVNGANRRVKTAPSTPNAPFVESSVVFSEPMTFSVPQPNTNDSEPEMYVGSSGTPEVDAGLTYDSKHGGWMLFIFAKKGRKPKFEFYGDRTNLLTIPKGKLGSVILTYRICWNGGVQMQTDGGGVGHTLYHWNDQPYGNGSDAILPVYPTASGAITNSALAAIQLKRIIAIGQQNGVHYDGSFMHGAAWSDVQLGVPKLVPGTAFFQQNHNHFVPTFFDWNWSPTGVGVDLSETGFGPQGKDKQGNWVVDFPLSRPSKDNGNGSYRFVPSTTRYAEEVVDINLMARLPVPVKTKGKPTKRSR